MRVGSRTGPTAVDVVAHLGQLVGHSVGDVGSGKRRMKRGRRARQKERSVFHLPGSRAGVGSDDDAAVVGGRYDGGLKTRFVQEGKKNLPATSK